MTPGTKIRFTRDHKGHDGLPTIKENDTAVYLGDSKIRILCGDAEGWLFTLLITAGYEEIKQSCDICPVITGSAEKPRCDSCPFLDIGEDA